MLLHQLEDLVLTSLQSKRQLWCHLQLMLEVDLEMVRGELCSIQLAYHVCDRTLESSACHCDVLFRYLDKVREQMIEINKLLKCANNTIEHLLIREKLLDALLTTLDSRKRARWLQ